MLKPYNDLPRTKTAPGKTARGKDEEWRIKADGLMAEPDERRARNTEQRT
jgi:hypothetical protein